MTVNQTNKQNQEKDTVKTKQRQSPTKLPTADAFRDAADQLKASGWINFPAADVSSTTHAAPCVSPRSKPGETRLQHVNTPKGHRHHTCVEINHRALGKGGEEGGGNKTPSSGIKKQTPTRLPPA